jgi:uncharacterized phage-like protein YoqJ
MGGSAWVRRSQSDPSQNESIKQFHVKTENWQESTKNKEKRGINEHDKIIQYFPHQDRTTVYQENSTWSNLMLSIQSGPEEMTPNSKDWDRSSFHRQRREYHVHSHLFQNLDADSRYEVREARLYHSSLPPGGIFTLSLTPRSEHTLQFRRTEG